MRALYHFLGRGRGLVRLVLENYDRGGFYGPLGFGCLWHAFFDFLDFYFLFFTSFFFWVGCLDTYEEYVLCRRR